MMEGYREKVTSAIIEKMRSILGDVTVQALEIFMNMNGTSLYSIYDEPEKVTDLMYALFRDSARLLEEEVAKEVCSRLKYVYDGKTSLKDLINGIKEIEGRRSGIGSSG